MTNYILSIILFRFNFVTDEFYILERPTPPFNEIYHKFGDLLFLLVPYYSSASFSSFSRLRISTAIFRNLLMKVLDPREYRSPMYLLVQKYLCFQKEGGGYILGDQNGAGSNIELYGKKVIPKFNR